MVWEVGEEVEGLCQMVVRCVAYLSRLRKNPEYILYNVEMYIPGITNPNKQYCT